MNHTWTVEYLDCGNVSINSFTITTNSLYAVAGEIEARLVKGRYVILRITSNCYDKFTSKESDLKAVKKELDNFDIHKYVLVNDIVDKA